MKNQICTSDNRIPKAIYVFSLGLILNVSLLAQDDSLLNVRHINIENNDNYDGFEFLKTNACRLFFLAEEGHGKQQTHKLTLKLLKYLYHTENVRVLAIEHGYSMEYLINKSLATQDSNILADIKRSNFAMATRETIAFIQNLGDWNSKLNEKDKIVVRSIDIEMNHTTALYVIRELIGQKEIPNNLLPTLGEIKTMMNEFNRKMAKYEAIGVVLYFDESKVKQIEELVLNEMANNSTPYKSFFSKDYEAFVTIVKDVNSSIPFSPSSAHRDSLMHDKFIKIYENHRDQSVLALLGNWHVLTDGNLGQRLKRDLGSPYFDKTLTIQVSSLKTGKNIIQNEELRKINRRAGRLLEKSSCSLIRQQKGNRIDYSVFMNDNKQLTTFQNIYKP
jgi:hypothetical protein